MFRPEQFKVAQMEAIEELMLNPSLVKAYYDIDNAIQSNKSSLEKKHGDLGHFKLDLWIKNNIIIYLGLGADDEILAYNRDVLKKNKPLDRSLWKILQETLFEYNNVKINYLSEIKDIKFYK